MLNCWHDILEAKTMSMACLHKKKQKKQLKTTQMVAKTNVMCGMHIKKNQQKSLCQNVFFLRIKLLKYLYKNTIT